MYAGLKFYLEIVDGARLGKLIVPFPQIAYWLNFLTSPHYGVQIIYTEQGTEVVTIYFDAYEEVYAYLGDRLHAKPELAYHKMEQLPLAS
jgi:hypothetical protein